MGERSRSLTNDSVIFHDHPKSASLCGDVATGAPDTVSERVTGRELCLGYITNRTIKDIVDRRWGNTKTAGVYEAILLRIFIKGHPYVPVIYNHDFKTAVELTLNHYLTRPLRDNGKIHATLRGLLRELERNPVIIL